MVSEDHESKGKSRIKSEQLAWFWLVIGALILPFAAWQTVIPLAAWLAPIFLLHFSRTSRWALVANPLIFIAYVFGCSFGGRGLPFSALGFIGNDLFKPLLWMLPYAIDRGLSRRLEAWPRLFVFPLAFTVVDWVLSVLRISSSGSPVYSQDSLALLQIVSITGMWGVTFLIMWCASAVNALWEHKFDWKSVRGITVTFVVVLLVVLAFGDARMAFDTPSSQHVAIATVTNNNTIIQEALNSIDWKTFNQQTDAQRKAAGPKLEATLDKMFERTETALRGGAKIVSWQEEAAWVFAEDKQDALTRASALARQYDAYLQISLGVFTRTEKLPYLLDQSILIDNTGRMVWSYDKTRLVPYDEAFITIPGKGVLPFADTPYGRLGTAICYETYYQSLLRQAGVNNVDILFAPSNDPREFALSDCAISIPRAIENGFSLVRAGGHGRTLVTDYEGRVLGSQDYFTNSSGIMITTVPTRGVTTVYSRIGDIFAYLCVVGLIALAGWGLFRRRKFGLIRHA
jgi:apolipoprotein N-acyltransferase